MPEVYYCTFWYPTIFHRNLSPLPDAPKSQEMRIDDRSGDPLFLRVSLDNEENLDVLLKETAESAPFFSIRLNRTTNRRNGFYQYRFNVEKDIRKPSIDVLTDILKRDVYFLAKNFYHEHEIAPDRDSPITGFVTKHEAKIDGPDNAILIEMLESYEQQFRTYAHMISDHIRFTEPIFEQLDSTPNREEEVRLLANAAKMIGQLCENALIEYTYCQTLLTSKYNRSFSASASLPNSTPWRKNSLEEKSDEWRRKALNIRNSIQYIENVTYKNRNKQYGVLRSLQEDIKQASDDIKKTLNHSETLLKEIREVSDGIKQVIDENNKTEGIMTVISIAGFLFTGVFGFEQLIPDGTTLDEILRVAAPVLAFVVAGVLAWLLRENRRSKRRVAATAKHSRG